MKLITNFYIKEIKIMKLDKDIATALFVVFLMIFGLGSMYLMEHGSENEERERYTEVEEAIESSNDLNNYLIENYGYVLEEGETL